MSIFPNESLRSWLFLLFTLWLSGSLFLGGPQPSSQTNHTWRLTLTYKCPTLVWLISSQPFFFKLINWFVYFLHTNPSSPFLLSSFLLHLPPPHPQPLFRESKTFPGMSIKSVPSPHWDRAKPLSPVPRLSKVSLHREELHKVSLWVRRRSWSHCWWFCILPKLYHCHWYSGTYFGPVKIPQLSIWNQWDPTSLDQLILWVSPSRFWPFC